MIYVVFVAQTFVTWWREDQKSLVWTHEFLATELL
jgi:hypothetical protein